MKTKSRCSTEVSGRDDLFDSVEEHGRFPSYEFEEVAGDRLDDIAAELQSRVEEGELYDFSLNDVVIDTRVVDGLGHTRGRVSRSERETVRLMRSPRKRERCLSTVCGGGGV